MKIEIIKNTYTKNIYAENEDLEYEDPENEDLEYEDLEYEDLEYEDPENEDLENEDPENEDPEKKKDPENEDPEKKKDPENEDPEKKKDPVKFKNQLIKIKLIKLKVYKRLVRTHQFDDAFNNVIDQIELYLKKAFRIISEYHYTKKKILFLGVPLLIKDKFEILIKKTKHLLIPESAWIKGLLTNNKSIFKFLLLRQAKVIRNKNLRSIKHTKLLLSIKKIPDLVVVFDPKTEASFLNEIFKYNVPTVTLNSNLFFDTISTYKVPGNFNFMDEKMNSFICGILTSIFTRKINYVKKKKIKKRKNPYQRTYHDYYKTKQKPFFKSSSFNKKK